MIENVPHSGVGMTKQQLVTTLDELAYSNSSQILCVHPLSSDGSQPGWRYLTAKDVAQAVDWVSWWIEKTIGQGSKSKAEAIAYLGANYFCYGIFMLACVKAGYLALFPSPRNSQQAHLHVLNACQCTRFVYSLERQSIVRQLQEAYEHIMSWKMPGLWDIMDQAMRPYPFDQGAYVQVEDDVAVIIHSSGTTGLPKPVYLTNGYFSAFTNLGHLRNPTGRVSGIPCLLMNRQLMFISSPFFHVMGILTFAASISHSTPFALSPDRPLTVDLLTRIVDKVHPDCGFLSPSILEELSVSEDGLKILKKLRLIFSGGAPLSSDVGDRLCQIVQLQQIVGSTEVGFLPTSVIEDKQKWQSFEWNPHYEIEMQPVADNSYELVIHASEHRDLYAIFHAFPGVPKYHTKDLFAPHPETPGLWRYQARFDDIIVLSNGEKFNPVSIEKVIEGHPLVSRVVIIGQGRFQSALLIEPNWSRWDEGMTESQFKDQIWERIQKANEIAPGHGKILRTKTGVASRAKPFKTTSKGSTQRRLVLEDYAEEIDLLYTATEVEYAAKLPVPYDASTDSISAYVRAVISVLLPLEQPIDPQRDIFSLGLDSLQSLRLANILQGAISAIDPSNNRIITSQDVYTHPSIERLSQFLSCLASGRDIDREMIIGGENRRRARITAIMENYTKSWPGMAKEPKCKDKHVVILTGSTGSLGCYLLQAFLTDPATAKIYCFSRSRKSKSRQVENFKQKGLEIPADFDGRVEYLVTDLGAPRFGLSDEKYKELTQTVDTIIHNAWAVNFNLQVEGFQSPYIESVRHFIDFSLESAYTSHIHYISSISTVGSWSHPVHGPSVPEVSLADPDVAMRQGYAESMYCAERICTIASEQVGVPVSIYRVGQIAGPTTTMGSWNKNEWLPSLVTTSKTLQAIPTTLGWMKVDWIPVDTLANIFIDIMKARYDTQTPTRLAIFHLVNPFPVHWDSIIQPIMDCWTVKSVDISDWITTLAKFTNPTEADLHDKPALKILDFFRGLTDKRGDIGNSHIETSQAQSTSETIRNLRPIQAALMQNWLRQWGL